MPNIVFCADGTWNHPGTDDAVNQSSYPTNVFKLFTNLAGIDDVANMLEADEQERLAQDDASQTRQIAKYLHGVGDSDNALVRLLGGATGAGIIARIVRGYTFVSRNYVSGARIHLIGFSRGAYTVRALAGLIQAKGLLDLPADTDKDTAYRLGAAVWYDYQHKLLAANRPDLLGRLEDLAADLPAFLSKPPTEQLVGPVRIATVAVWDTVGSLGIPEFNNSGEQADLFRFASTSLGAGIDAAIHAVSRDEERGDFTPTLWDPDPRAQQWLFAGAHGDVGGGYPTAGGASGLSDLTLDWMTGLLTQQEVLFAPAPSFVPAPNALADAHQPWLTPPFSLLPKGRREFPATLGVHASVVARRNGGPVRPDPSLAAALYE